MRRVYRFETYPHYGGGWMQIIPPHPKAVVASSAITTVHDNPVLGVFWTWEE